MPRRATTSPSDPPGNQDEEQLSPNDAPGSSTASSDASEPFFSDPGPAFNPDEAGELPEDEQPAARELAEPPAGWDEAVVRDLLAAKGVALHSLIGKAEQDWIYLPLELRAVAPPLTRILNRIPAAAAAAGSGDELALIIALGAYVGRSVQERQAAIKAALEDEPEVRGAPVFDARPPEQPAGGLTIPTLVGGAPL